MNLNLLPKNGSTSSPCVKPWPTGNSRIRVNRKTVRKKGGLYPFLPNEPLLKTKLNQEISFLEPQLVAEKWKHQFTLREALANR